MTKIEPSTITIHPTADIHPTAIIYPNVTIGPRVKIGPYAIVGAPPEHRTATQNGVKYIEADCVLREFSRVHAPTEGITYVGPRTWLLSNAHIGHDAIVSSDCTLGVNAVIGGHAFLCSRVNVGLNATIHQRLVVGPGVMIGMGAAVTKNVPGGITVAGVPARVIGKNKKFEGVPVWVGTDMISQEEWEELFQYNYNGPVDSFLEEELYCRFYTALNRFANRKEVPSLPYFYMPEYNRDVDPAGRIAHCYDMHPHHIMRIAHLVWEDWKKEQGL